MIYIPSNYFVFNDLKFLTLDAVKRFKKKKGEKKDLLDVKLIESFCSMNSDQWRYRLLLIQNAYRRKKAHLILRFKSFLRIILVRLHLLEFVKRKMVGKS